MMWCIFFCLFFTVSAFATETEFSIDAIQLSGECEPLATVGDFVNVISGTFFQVDTDLVSESVDPYRFTRYYENDKSYFSFLGFNMGLNLPIEASKPKFQYMHFYAGIQERSGFTLPFKGLSDGNYTLDQSALEKGYTNLCRAGLSGKQDLHNARAKYDGY